MQPPIRQPPIRIHARTDRDDFLTLVEHALTAAGATTRLLSDAALEILWRASRGIIRTTSTLLRTSLSIAHERDETLVDDAIMSAAIDELALTRPSAVAKPTLPARRPSPKARAKSGTKSRG